MLMRAHISVKGLEIPDESKWKQIMFSLVPPKESLVLATISLTSVDSDDSVFFLLFSLVLFFFFLNAPKVRNFHTVQLNRSLCFL